MSERKINKNVALPESIVASVEAIRKEFGFKTDVETYTYVLTFGIHNIVAMLEQGYEHDVADYPFDDDDYDTLEDGTEIVE